MKFFAYFLLYVNDMCRRRITDRHCVDAARNHNTAVVAVVHLQPGASFVQRSSGVQGKSTPPYDG